MPALVLYCEALKEVCDVPYIYGATKDSDRSSILTAFKTRSEVYWMDGWVDGLMDGWMG